MKITNQMLCASARAAGNAMADQAELWQAASEPHVFSARFEAKMETLLRRAKRSGRQRVLRTAAAILLALLLTGAAWLAVDTDARAGFIGWIKELFGREYTYDYTSDAPADVVEAEYELSWVPEGYTLFTVIGTPDNPLYVYQNPEEIRFQFSYITQPNGVSWLIDVDNTESQHVMIHNFTADLFIGKNGYGDSSIVWEQDGYAFYVTGVLSKADLIQIAEGVSKK